MRPYVTTLCGMFDCNHLLVVSLNNTRGHRELGHPNSKADLVQ